MRSAPATMADDIHSTLATAYIALRASSAPPPTPLDLRRRSVQPSATCRNWCTDRWHVRERHADGRGDLLRCVRAGESIQTRSEAIPRRFVENVDSFNSVADAWSEDRKSFRLVVPNIERGVNHAWRNKDSVACAKNLLLLVEPLLDLAAENEHHLFLIGDDSGSSALCRGI
jgi:hypothetical protein